MNKTQLLFALIAASMASSQWSSAQASRGLPADIETLDQLWQENNSSCRQGDPRACELRENFRQIIKQQFPNAVPASCPPNIKRTWFETGRQGMAAGCQML
jgi:hypothetical protein